MVWIAAAFIIIGAGLQIAGVLVVVISLRDAARALRAYETRPQLIYVPGLEQEISFGIPTVSGGVPLNIEQRVERLEAQLQTGLDKRDRELRRDVEDQIKDATTAIEGTIGRETKDLAAFVTDNLRGERGPTLTGVRLLVLGLVAATVGGVLSLYA
jgi:hypothetical protein